MNIDIKKLRVGDVVVWKGTNRRNNAIVIYEGIDRDGTGPYYVTVLKNSGLLTDVLGGALDSENEHYPQIIKTGEVFNLGEVIIASINPAKKVVRAAKKGRK